MTNKEAFFDNYGYTNEINQLQNEIEIYNKCLDALERITGARKLKTLEEVKIFICGLSGFPAVQQSAELLNFTDEYNFLKDNLANIKSKKTEITSADEELIREKHTTRLTDELQSDYLILEQIAENYAKLSNFTFIHSIRSSDYGVFNIDTNSLFQIAQFVKR